MDELERAYRLLQSQQFGEGYQALKKFVKRNPKQGEAWYLMAQVDREFGRWDDAIANMKQAVAAVPRNHIYRAYLAMARLFGNRGRDMALAIDDFAALLAAHPTNQEAPVWAANLLTLAMRAGLPERVVEAIKPWVETHPVAGVERLRLAAGTGIACFIAGDVAQAERHAGEALLARDLAYDSQGKALPGDYAFYHIYAQYVLILMEFRRKHAEFYEAESLGMMHAIGESHCLGPSGMVLQGRRVQSHLLMGCKAYYYTVPQGEPWKFHLTRVIQETPKQDPILVIFGEIDCRPDEGIMRQIIHRPDYNMQAEVAAQVAEYVKFVKIAQLRRAAPTYVCGVPASHPMRKELLAPHHYEAFLAVIAHFNACLKAECAKQELPFVDVYAATLGSDGWAKPGSHIDEVHLVPSVLATAFAAVNA